MYTYVKQIVLLVALVLAVLFVLFLVNQTAQLVALAGGVHPLLGQVVLYLLLIFYAAVIVVPLVWIGRMPRALFPPEETEGEKYRAYLEKLSRRLSKNPHLEGMAVEPGDVAGIEEALKKLEGKADERIKSAASSVFIMTAISQYGALDAVIVLLAQFRMIWQVTTLYHQRPGLRDMVYLYTNVLATAFLVSRIENLKLLEDQLEPVIASILGSSLSSLTPTFNTAATIVTNSVIQGSANAFLTLRVGVITKMYCASLTKPERGQLRRMAAVQAASMLGKVLGESAYTVSGVVFRAAAKAGKRPFRYGQEFVTRTGRNTWEAGKSTFSKGEHFMSGLSGAVKNIRFVRKKKPLEEER